MQSKAKQRDDAPARWTDPLLDWAIATNFRHVRPGRWLPLLVEFDAEALARETHDDALTPLQRFAGLKWLDARSRLAVRVPELFRKPPRVLATIHNFHFGVLLVDRARAREIIAGPGWQNTIVGVSLGPPLDLAEDRDPRRVPERGLDSASNEPASGFNSASRVVVAVLDEGIAFAHERFRDTQGTRITHLWRQDGVGPPLLESGMPGTELTSTGIDAALATHRSNGRVNEDLLYQSLGAVDFSKGGFKALARRRSHGTHVLDLAAGAAPGSRPIIAVELPDAAVADPAGTPLYGHVLMGIVYVLLRAETIRANGERLPIVLNLSYGPHHGPHDGSTFFERAVDLLIAQSQSSDTPLDVVLAAGNSRQSRSHALFELPRGQNKTLRWCVQPEDLTPSFLELWVPASGFTTTSVDVTSPLGETIQVSASQLHDDVTGPKGIVFQADYIAPPPSQGRARVLVSLGPTATDPPLDPTLPTAAPGLWTVDVINSGSADLTIEGWIGRDGPIGGRRARGRQSYFDDPSYRRYDIDGRPAEFDPASNPSYVSRSRTLSGIATGAHPHIVGGFRRLPAPATGVPASYSSMGPVAGGPRSRNAPDLLAPSEDSQVCRGVLAAGTFSGSTVTMNGTSVAAPQVARWLTDRIAAGISTPSPIPRPPLVAPPTTPPAPFVPPGFATAVAGDGLLPSPQTRLPRV